MARIAVVTVPFIKVDRHRSLLHYVPVSPLMMSATLASGAEQMALRDCQLLFSTSNSLAKIRVQSSA
jgi:hypothetical protein